MKKFFKKILAGICLVPCMLMATACFGKVDQEEGYDIFKSALATTKEYTGSISIIGSLNSQTQGGLIDLVTNFNFETGYDDESKQYYSIDKSVENITSATFVELENSQYVKYEYSTSMFGSPEYKSSRASETTAREMINEDLEEFAQFEFPDNLQDAYDKFNEMAFGYSDDEEESEFETASNIDFLMSCEPKSESLEISQRSGVYQIEYYVAYSEIEPVSSSKLDYNCTLTFVFNEDYITAIKYNMNYTESKGKGLEKTVTSSKESESMVFQYSFNDKTFKNYDDFPLVNA